MSLALWIAGNGYEVDAVSVALAVRQVVPQVSAVDADCLAVRQTAHILPYHLNTVSSEFILKVNTITIVTVVVMVVVVVAVVAIVIGSGRNSSEKLLRTRIGAQKLKIE